MSTSVLDTLLESRSTAAQELETRRSTLMDELTSIVHDDEGNPREDITSEQEERSKAILTEVDEIDEQIDGAVGAIEKRIRAEAKRAKKAKSLKEAREELNDGVEVGNAISITEPLVYGLQPDGKTQSPHSWYADQARRALERFTGAQDGGATQRLSEWAHQVERNIELGEGRGAQYESEFREMNREFGESAQRARLKEVRERGRVSLDAKVAELRVGSGVIPTGGGATAAGSSGGAAFVLPYFVDSSKYAPWKELGRPFADQCNKQPLPDYGMNIYLPAVQHAIEVAIQTNEEETVKETGTAVFGYLEATLKTEAGQQYLTQQLLDRAGPGFAFDKMVFDQLERDYAPKFDIQVLEAALSSATEVTGWTGNGSTGTAQNSFSLFAKGAAGGFAGQVASAKGAMRTLEGTNLNPTHLFVQQKRWEFISASTDENGRPLVTPDYSGPFASFAGGSASGDEGVEGFTGYQFAGLPVFTDGSIPKRGTGTGTYEQDGAIVGHLPEVWVYEGPAVTRMIPQTKGDKLLVLAQRYSYFAVIKRYPKCITVITGAGMKVPVYTN